MTIYLDMDGVLADFHRGVHEKFGLPYSYENWPAYAHQYDYFKGDDPLVSFARVNGQCGEDFWHRLHWMHDGKEILATLEDRYGKENICLLTRPMPNPGSWNGKFKWVRDNMPDYTERLIVTWVSKGNFAERGTILFDDDDQNVDGFRINGGKAVLVPRPWNSEHELSYCAAGYIRETII